MNDDKVTRIDFLARGAMARRGAPDKGGFPPETVEVECPECEAVLCLDAAVLGLKPEVLCAGCDATIPVAIAR